MTKKASKIILHQFPLSHFCEKVRITLHLKGLEYEVKNHLPLLHMLTVRRVSGQQMVPVLQFDGKVITDSNTILKFLDKNFPQNSLYPKVQKEQHLLDKFVQRVDVGVGVHLRRFFYYYILPNRKSVCDFLAGPDFSLPERTGFKIVAPLVTLFMKKGMKISPTTAERSKKILLQTLDDLDKKIARKKYFFGSKHSAADVTVAALLAPLVQPTEHPMDWPKQQPAELMKFRSENKNRRVFKWVQEYYQALEA